MREPSIYMSELTFQIWNEFSSKFRHQNSINVYFGDINEFIDLSKKDFLEITKSDADKFYQYLMKKNKNGNLAKTTLKKKVKELHKFSDYIVEKKEEYDIPKTFQNYFLCYAEQYFSDEELKEIPSLKEIDQLLEASKKDYMFYTILMLAQRMGLKSTVICNLKPSDIITYKKDTYILVREKKNQEPYFVPEDALVILKIYLSKREQNEYLFYNKWGRKLNVQYLSDKMKKLAIEAGTKQYSITDIRNSFGVAMFTYGVESNLVAKQMGISSWHIERYKKSSLSTQLMKDASNLVHIKILPPE